MLSHIQQEVEALRSLLVKAMPRGSAEWHLLEHELAEQERKDRVKRRADFWGHILRTAGAAALLLGAHMLYLGVTTKLTTDTNHTEVAK